jgi:hypothetical protein
MKEILSDITENDSSILIKSPVKFYSKLHKLAIDIANMNEKKNKNSNKMKSLAFHGIEYMLLFPTEVARKDTVISYILDKISPNNHYTNYTIKKILEKEYRVFARINSFRTLGRPSINYGIFIDNVLYFTLSLRKMSDGYEIVNFVRKNGEVSTVMFDVMFNVFLLEYKPKSITYFVDRRIDRYNYLLKIGFNVVGFGPPRWYLINDNIIERNTNVYVGNKVWDCGTIRLQWKT